MQFYKYIVSREHDLPWQMYSNHVFSTLAQNHLSLIEEYLYLQQILLEFFIFFMTSFNASLCCFVNNQGRALVFMRSPLLFDSMKAFSAWLDSCMSVQILEICSLSHLPSNIFHSVCVTLFPMCIVSNKCMIGRSL